jgi:hypothetical protein
MVWLCPSQGDVALAADKESATTELGSPDQRKCAVELLRQAAAELQANHFDTARSLTKQAADLNATYSLFDVRPEHVLAEIERKERSAGATVKGSVADPEHPVVQTLKPRASLVATAAPNSDPFAIPVAADAPKTEAPTAGDVARAESHQASDVCTFPAPLFPISQAAVEQAAPSVRTPRAAVPDRLKGRAIEILDRGLQALDEQRLDDAERYARAALSLHASFSQLEYKPEYLITEIGIARARLRLDAATSQSSPHSPPQSASQSPVPGSAERTFQRPTPAAVMPVAAAAPAGAQSYASAQSAATSTAATSGHERAERLLQEALSDLHAGRDDMARARIEGALGAIHSVPSRPLPFLPSTTPTPTAAAPPVAKQLGPNHLDLPQPGMPRMGLPTYVRDPVRDERDLALKPMHDPYLGDEPHSTQKSTAGENSLRETLPDYTPLNPALSLNRPLPRMEDLPEQQAAAPRAPAAVNQPQASQPQVTQTHYGQSQTFAAPQSQPARVRWPETDPAAAPAQTAAAPVDQAAPNSNTGANQFDGRSGPRYSYAPVHMKSWKADSSEEEQPGYFRKLWNALTGE